MTVKVGDRVHVTLTGATISAIGDHQIALRLPSGYYVTIPHEAAGVTVALMTSGVGAAPPYRSQPGGAVRGSTAAWPVLNGEQRGPGTPSRGDDWTEAPS